MKTERVEWEPQIYLQYEDRWKASSDPYAGNEYLDACQDIRSDRERNPDREYRLIKRTIIEEVVE